MNWKNTITNICALLIVITGALVTAIQSGVLTFLPAWVSPICVLIGVVAAALVSWATGKNPNLTAKTPRQVDDLNNAQAATKELK